MSAADRLPVVEPAALERLNRIGGQEFLLEMIELFLENGPQRLAAARAAFDAGDYPALYRAAHSLKSTAGNLGARGLQTTAERVEGLAADETVQGVPALLVELSDGFERVREALEAERDRRKGHGT